MSNPEIPQTVQDYGFVEHTRAADFRPLEDQLLPCYQDKLEGPLPTELLTTDQGNQIMLTSLIGVHKGLAEVADNIEQKGQSQYSDQIQGYVLSMLKSLADENGRGIKTVKSSKDTIYYSGNTGVSNGRLVRVYLTKVGNADTGTPVYAKIAACRTKKNEDRIYKLLGLDGRIQL